MSSPFKGNSDNFGRFHPLLPPKDFLSPHRPFGYKQKGNEKWSYHIALLGWKPPCWVGVEAESELESESIFSVRSRSWSRSRLKVIDSAALIHTIRWYNDTQYQIAHAFLHVFQYSFAFTNFNKSAITKGLMPHVLSVMASRGFLLFFFAYEQKCDICGFCNVKA